MRLYLAAPLFTEAERAFNLVVAPARGRRPSGLPTATRHARNARRGSD